MSIRTFRLLATLEAITWIALIGASIAKRAADMPAATQIMGPIHGTAFIVYAIGVSLVREDLGWDGRRTLGALLAAFVPLGTILIVERRWLTSEELAKAPGARAGAPA